MEDPRIRKLAHFLINYSVNLKQNENILIEVHGKEVPLARALIDEVYKVGGKPYLQVFDYNLERALLMNIDEQHMKDITSYELNRMKNMDAYIDIRATNNLSEFNDIPEDKIKIYRKDYWFPLHLKQRCSNTKWAVLRYPNDSMSQLARMSTEEYEDFYFNACLLNYSKMAKAMESLVKLMNTTDNVNLKGPETDLEFSIKNIASVALAGTNNIPDGEVYTAPVKNSVNGKIKFNCPSPYEGYMYNDICLEFKDGKIIKATSNNTEKINKIFDTDEGSKYVGEFAIGVNPVIKHPMGDILFDEKIDGSFHLTPGNCYDNAYNGNKSALHWDLVSIQRPEYGGGEIYFDDVLIRKNGVFVLDELKCLNPENLI